MQEISVRFVGPVRRPGPEREIRVPARGLETVSDLLRHLGYSDREQSRLHVLSSGRRLAIDAPLAGVASLEILVAIGGG
jgi:hypothetical protein